MKPRTTRIIVSGTFALLVAFTLNLRANTSAPANKQVANPVPSAVNTPPAPPLPPGAVSAPGDLSSAAKQVVKLFQAGTSADIMTTYAQASDQLFNLSADDILYLNKLGLPQDTIHAMLVRDRDYRGQISAQQAEVQTELSGAAAPNPTPTYSDASVGDSQPGGYTDNGIPYYYAYPNEGYSEASTSTPTEMMNSSGAYPYYFNYSNDNLDYLGNGEYLAPNYAPWGWGWVWPWSWGFNNFGFDSFRHHGFNHFHKGFANRGFNKAFIGHSAIAPHQSFHGTIGARGAVGVRNVNRGGMGFHGGGHGGGGHR